MKRSSRAWIAIWLGAVLLALHVRAGATTLQKLKIDELVAAADTVVAGTCEKVEAVWLDKKIYTVATVRLYESVKGAAAKGDSVDVYFIGGEVKDPLPVRMEVNGTTSMTVGEEALLFLESKENVAVRAPGGGTVRKTFRRPVGMFQGKVPIHADPKTGEKMAAFPDPVKGAHMVDKQGKAIVKPGKREEDGPERGSLEGMLGLVQKIEKERLAAKDKK